MYGARKCARDLRDSDPPAIRNRDLDNPKARSDRLHLHLAGPSKILILHLQTLQTIPTDGPERPQVGVPEAGDREDQRRGERIPDPGLRQQRSRLGAPQPAGTDYQVGLILLDRGKNRREFIGMIRVVPIEEDHDVRRPGPPQEIERGKAGAPVAPARFANDLDLPGIGVAHGTCRRCRSVRRAVVGDDHPIEKLHRQIAKNERQTLLLVEDRNHDGDALHSLLQGSIECGTDTPVRIDREMPASEHQHATPLLVPRIHAALSARHASIERILARADGVPSSSALHDLRVDLRRLAAIAKLTRGVPRPGDGELLRRAARDLRRTLSGERTREVSGQRLRVRFQRNPNRHAAALRLADRLSARKRTARHGPERAVAGPLSSLRRAFASREAELAPTKSSELFSSNSDMEKALRKKIRSRLEKKRKSLLAAGVPTAKTLHPIRIAAKEFRYSLEFVRDAIRDSGPLLLALKEFQASTGEAQDRVELVEIVRRLAAPATRSSQGRESDLIPILARDAQRFLKRAQLSFLPLLERLRNTEIRFSETGRSLSA